MEYLVINEMSVECQASSLQHVDALMKEMADALKALDPIRRELFVHENICNHEDSHHAPMDLHDEIAQQVLDRAVSVPGEKRVVGLREGRYYVFPHIAPRRTRITGFSWPKARSNRNCRSITNCSAAVLP